MYLRLLAGLAVLLALAPASEARRPRALRKIDLRPLDLFAAQRIVHAPPKPAPPPDLVTGVAQQVLRGPLTHLTTMTSMPVGRIDMLATGFLGGCWDF